MASANVDLVRSIYADWDRSSSTSTATARSQTSACRRRLGPRARSFAVAPRETRSRWARSGLRSDRLERVLRDVEVSEGVIPVVVGHPVAGTAVTPCNKRGDRLREFQSALPSPRSHHVKGERLLDKVEVRMRSARRNSQEFARSWYP